MKLITKTIFYYLLVCIPLLIISGIISFEQIRNTVRENNDEVMWEEKRDAEKVIQAFTGPVSNYRLDKETEIVIDSSNGNGFRYSDIYKMDEDAEKVNYRILKSYYRSKGTNYLITVIRPTLEEDDLIESLSGTLLTVISGLILAFFIINFFISKALWKPFYRTINKLNEYQINTHSPQAFESSKTKEFAQLNEALNKMTNKIYSDFVLQKEFTENASHEMQTPLAIIKAKVDLLMQSPNLGEKEMEQLEGIDLSVSKLSSLNKALLLLAKIENHQFKDAVEVDLGQVTDKVLSNFEDRILAKNISVQKNINKDVKVKMHPALADILITNLVQNAIRHNSEKGKINISITAKEFKISNSGQALNIKPEELFVRFKKNDASKESLGLGLSIVKSITNLYGMKIDYSFNHDLHIFTITTHNS
jgi:signal transduction histidine kinase